MENGEHITVLWGQNKHTATRIADILNNLGINAVVGGDLSSDPETYFLGHHVFRQIETSHSVIVLINQVPLRPNILIEMGYALAHLPRGSVYPVLIGLSYKDIPSDLRGIWMPSFLTGGVDIDLVSDSPIFEKIAKSYKNHLSTIKNHVAETSFDVIVQWNNVLSTLNAFTENRIGLPTETLKETICNIAIPSLFNGDSQKTLHLLDSLTRITTSHFSEIKLARSMIEYYNLVDYATINDTKIELSKMENIQRKLTFLIQSGDLSHWGMAFAHNFLGITLRKISSFDGSLLSYNRGRQKEEIMIECLENLNKSLRIISDIEIISPSHYYSSLMWKGFIYFNIANSKLDIGDICSYDHYINEACNNRLAIYNFASGKTTDNIKTQLLFEYLIAKLNAHKNESDKIFDITAFAIEEIKDSIKFNSRGLNKITRNLHERVLCSDQKDAIKKIIRSLSV